MSAISSTSPAMSTTGGGTPTQSATSDPTTGGQTTTPNNPPPATTPNPPPASTTTRTTPTIVTSSITAPSAPPSTQIVTSVVTQTPTGRTSSGQTVVVTTVTSSESDGSTGSLTGTASSTSSTATSAAQNSGGGLSPGGKTAIAVVIPIFVVAGLIFAGLLLWRRRNRNKTAEEERRKEMEAYGYNPNDDPTLPAVAASSINEAENADERSGGYRGWGPSAAAAAHRHPSGSGSAGMTSTMMSDQQQGGYQSPGSPTQGTHNSDGHSGDPLMGNRRGDANELEAVGNLGAGPAAGAAHGGVLRRGPSNASSTYSAGDRSNQSIEHGQGNLPPNNDYYAENPYYQHGLYDNPYNSGQQPVIRDNPARRLTNIQEANVQESHGGIARNF